MQALDDWWNHSRPWRGKNFLLLFLRKKIFTPSNTWNAWRISSSAFSDSCWNIKIITVVQLVAHFQLDESQLSHLQRHHAEELGEVDHAGAILVHLQYKQIWYYRIGGKGLSEKRKCILLAHLVDHVLYLCLRWVLAKLSHNSAHLLNAHASVLHFFVVFFVLLVVVFKRNSPDCSRPTPPYCKT